MRVVVPFDAATPKTRLDDVLSVPERHAFSRAMLVDVVDAVAAAGGEPSVVATAPLSDPDPADPVDVDAPVTVDDRPLTACVNAQIEAGVPVAVVMADLGLVTPAAVRRLLSAPGDLAIVPGRGGGTNAFSTSHPAFRVDYHDGSYLDHLRRARSIGASVSEVDSARLSTDVDERADLVEVLLRGEGRAAAWLRDRFELAVEGGRLGVRRRDAD
ncbi:MAG: 2-phospho-L-lactate guanylyltransferase [Haloarculaceae archaeon]